ncbi:Smr/MutS family protein [Pseudorhodoplanes sp.]|uniref:Smr/MutS family protein n=1 Tax=Pseudorhodoplanes sp. TaxID=1934341 RepID=UPI002CD64E8A|nr:Smr/MutS family protein [Pseudorhodoplanes sp.]HWV50972.1 Smr/MutS family protein [Pseudorhodoplanes sp.]
MTAGGSRRGRRLSSDDIALWEGVTKSVRPLRKRVRIAEPSAGAVQTHPPKMAKAPKHVATATVPPAPAPAPAPKKPPPLASLDRKAKQKIARGHDAIDARLDLHGHTQAEAHDALLRFLRRTQARGGRVVLVITGKGVRGEHDRGILRRAVPMWLALPEFRQLVIGFDSAAITHGGEGALYVRLRKTRERP